MVQTDYFENPARDVASIATQLEQFHTELSERIDGESLTDVAELPLEENLLDGLTTDDDGMITRARYEPATPAGLFARTFGVTLANPKSAIQKHDQGFPIQSEVAVESTPFLEAVAELREQADEILSRADAQSKSGSGQPWKTRPSFDGQDGGGERDAQRPSSVSDLIEQPERLVDLISDFLERTRDLLPNTSTDALTLWAVSHVPRGHIENELADSRIALSEADWEAIESEWGLSPIYTPEMDPTTSEQEELKRANTVYGYPDGSLGDALRGFVRLAYEKFHDSAVYESLEGALPVTADPLAKYRAAVRDPAQTDGLPEGIELSTIRDAIRDWDSPTNLVISDPDDLDQEDWHNSAEDENTINNVVGGNHIHGLDRARYKITNATYAISELTFTTVSSERKYEVWYAEGVATDTHACDESCRYHSFETGQFVPDVLDQLAPMLLLLEGVDYRLELTQDSFALQRLSPAK